MMLLSTQSGWVFAALVVSWTAIALLALVVANLHARLRLVEQRGAEGRHDGAYARLLGQRVPLPTGAAPRAIVWVSEECAACRRVLEALPAGTPSVLVASVDHAEPSLPPGILPLPDGPALAAALGIRVTPFAVALDDTGTIVRAGPIGSLGSLAEFVPRTPERALHVTEVRG